MRERIIKHGQRVKRKPKADWRARGKKRKQAQQRFKPKSLLRNSAPAHATVKFLYGEMLKLHNSGKSEQQIGGLMVKTVLEHIGAESALAFVRKHAKTYVDLSFRGYDKEIFGETPPTSNEEEKHNNDWVRSKRLAQREPLKWYDSTLDALRKELEREGRAEEFEWEIAKDYWGVLNKLLESEQKTVLEHFRENAISFLEHRQVHVRTPEGEVRGDLAQLVDTTINSNKRTILYGKLSFPEFEKQIVLLSKYTRDVNYRMGRRINEAVTKSISENSINAPGGKIKLKKARSWDRRIINELRQEIFEEVLRKANAKNEEPNMETIQAIADKQVRKKFKKIGEKLLEAREPKPESRAPERSKAERRRAKAERHREAEKRRAEKRRKEIQEAETAAGEKQAEQEFTKISQTHRKLRRLKDSAPNVFEFIMRNRKKAKASKQLIEDMASKLLLAELPRRAVHEAINAGFEKEFPAEAMPSLIYCLTRVGDLQRRPDTVESWVKSRCQKLGCHSKYVKPVIKFLVREKIFEQHHSPKGKGRRLAIYRQFA